MNVKPLAYAVMYGLWGLPRKNPGAPLILDIYTTNEAATLDYDVHRLRYKEFYAAEESVDFYLFILCNGCIPQVHSDTSEESIEPGTVEWLATIDAKVKEIRQICKMEEDDDD